MWIITYLIIDFPLEFAIQSTLFLPWANTSVSPMNGIEQNKGKVVIFHEYLMSK